MSEPKTFHVWPPETGILDLPEDWQRLVVPEVARVRETWAQQRERLAGTPQLDEFTEQLNREWAIETGIIENLYDIERGVTQTLIEQGFQASILEHGSTNKPTEYVLALLNDQKEALEGLFSFVKQDRPLSTSYVKELHAAMTRSQPTTTAVDPQGNIHEVELLRGDWKKHPNYPHRNDTVYHYCPPEQTASEIDRLVEMHLQHVEAGIPSEVEAAWLHHRFTQIHPFQDGNGRVARALASLVLIRAGLFPLNISREEKSIYIQSLEHADSGDLRSLTLIVARLQRSAMTRSNQFIARLGIKSQSVEEAAKSLLNLAQGPDGIPNNIAKRRVSELFQAVSNSLRPVLTRIRGTLGAGEDSITEITYTGSPVEDSNLEFLTHSEIAPLKSKSIPIISQATGFKISEARLGEMLFTCIAWHPELDRTIQAIAIVSVAGKRHTVPVTPFEWLHDFMLPGVENQLNQWVEQAVIAGLDYAGQLLASEPDGST